MQIVDIEHTDTCSLVGRLGRALSISVHLPLSDISSVQLLPNVDPLASSSLDGGRNWITKPECDPMSIVVQINSRILSPYPIHVFPFLGSSEMIGIYIFLFDIYINVW